RSGRPRSTDEGSTRETVSDRNRQSRSLCFSAASVGGRGRANARRMVARELTAPVVRRNANPIIMSDFPLASRLSRRRSSSSVHGRCLFLTPQDYSNYGGVDGQEVDKTCRRLGDCRTGELSQSLKCEAVSACRSAATTIREPCPVEVLLPPC